MGRYHRYVMESHRGWRVFGLCLTPFGEAPSHGAYSPLGYGTICGVLEGVLEDRGSALNPDGRMSMEHYVQVE